jgi:hypothetical protein
VADEEQHLKPDGPGHWLDTVEPAQSEVQRQLPEAPLPQLGLLQQRIVEASAGQAPVMVVPPLAEQSEVEIQTPRKYSVYQLVFCYIAMT